MNEENTILQQVRELNRAYRDVAYAYRWGHVENKIATTVHYETVRQEILDSGALIERGPDGKHRILPPGAAQWVEISRPARALVG